MKGMHRSCHIDLRKEGGDWHEVKKQDVYHQNKWKGCTGHTPLTLGKKEVVKWDQERKNWLNVDDACY